MSKIKLTHEMDMAPMTPTQKDSTALQEFIEWWTDPNGCYSEWEVTEKAKSLLPKEREVIEDAFNEGYREYGQYCINEPLLYNGSSDYFTQTFKQ